MFYITVNLIDLIDESLYLFTNLSISPNTPPLWCDRFSTSVSELDFFFFNRFYILVIPCNIYLPLVYLT